jgi:chaperonin GroEL (HSP60 family)
VLRGANDYMLDEMERSIHDSLSIVKRTLESNTVSKCSVVLGFLYFIVNCRALCAQLRILKYLNRLQQSH